MTEENKNHYKTTPMEENGNQQQIIDLHKVFKTLWDRRKVFFILWAAVFVLSCIWILPQPRWYTCEVKLAPESGGSDAGDLAGLASSFGFNIGSMMTEDAISPLLYPDLFQSPDFMVSLYDIQIRTADGEIETDYYTYRKKHCKSHPLSRMKSRLMRMIAPKEHSVILSSGMERDGAVSGVNPFCMSRDDSERLKGIIEDIGCSVDKKTDVITISVKDQDRLVCALMADSVKVRLQEFITLYRTRKAREDAEYYRNLLENAGNDYNAALIAYGDFVDGHSGMTRQYEKNEAGRLKNEVELKLNAYNVLKTQLVAAEAKVRERTPAFTTIQSATVPARPSGPKRKLFVLGMLIVSTIVASVWLARKELFWELFTDL